MPLSTPAAPSKRRRSRPLICWLEECRASHGALPASGGDRPTTVIFGPPSGDSWAYFDRESSSLKKCQASLWGPVYGRALRDLAALGYAAEWDIVAAEDVGAPHRRKRLFIVAHARQERHGRRVIRSPSPEGAGRTPERGEALADSDRSRPQEREGVGGDPRQECATSVGSRGQVGDAGGRVAEQSAGQGATTRGSQDRGASGESSGPSGDSTGDAQPSVGGDADGFSDRLDAARWPAPPGEPQHEWEPPRTCESYRGRASELKALGNAVVPAVAEFVGRRIVEALS